MQLQRLRSDNLQPIPDACPNFVCFDTWVTEALDVDIGTELMNTLRDATVQGCSTFSRMYAPTFINNNSFSTV